MYHLTARERELVSLGAAIGSNCISCIEYHVPASRNAGLTDAQISEAIHLADKLRQVPARKTLRCGRQPPRRGHCAGVNGGSGAAQALLRPGAHFL